MSWDSVFLFASLMVLWGSLSRDHLQLASAFPVIRDSRDLVYVISYVFFGYKGFSHDLYVLSLAILVLILLCFMGGIFSYSRYGWAMPLLLGGPLVIALMFLLVRLYPALGRAFLFATPALYLLVGFGLSYLYQRIPYRKPLYVLFVLLLIPCVVTFGRYYSRPVGGVMGALEFIAKNQQPGTLVFSDPFSASSVACYQALKNPIANDLQYANRPEEWIEGRMSSGSEIDSKAINLLSQYDNRPICFLAETRRYTRAPKDEYGDLPEISDVILKYLANSRKLEYSYTTTNVYARGLAIAVGPKTSQNGQSEREH